MDPSDSRKSEYQIVIQVRYVLIGTINIDREYPVDFHFSLMPLKLTALSALARNGRMLGFIFAGACFVSPLSCKKAKDPRNLDPSEALEELITTGELREKTDYVRVSAKELESHPENYTGVFKGIEIELEVGKGGLWLEDGSKAERKVLNFRASSGGTKGIKDTVVSAISDFQIYHQILEIDPQPGDQMIVSGSVIPMRAVASEFCRTGLITPPQRLPEFQIYADKIIFHRHSKPRRSEPTSQEVRNAGPADRQSQIKPEGKRWAAENSNGAEETITEETQPGPPSDRIVRNVASTINITEVKTFKRGQTLQSLGGGNVPVGTTLYPIKLENYPVPIYLSQDEFGDWRFNIGDNPRVIPVRAPSPAKPDKVKEEEAKESEVKHTEPAPQQKLPPPSDKAVRLAEAKGELAALESRISTERQRFKQATDTINRLTNFKKTPVKEGSAAYHQCMAASQVIQEVEQKAPGMTAERTRLQTVVESLSSNEKSN